MKQTNRGLDKYETKQELINDAYFRVEHGYDVNYKALDTDYRFMYGNHQLDLLDITFEEYLDIYFNVLVDEYKSATWEERNA